MAALPAPQDLTVFAPWTPAGDGAHGLVELDGVTENGLGRLRQLLQAAFAQGATVGLCAVPRVRAVFFDMDATVIAEESIVELATHAGKADLVAQITERAMAGELDFKAALEQRVALLEGLPEVVLAAVAERLTLNRGIWEFVGLCQVRGVPTFMVSGGFSVLAEAVQRRVGFTAVKANGLAVSGGRLTGRLAGEVVDAQGKLDFLRATCARLGLAPEEVAAVGDGANDRLMLEAAGVAVGFCPKPVLREALHAQIGHADHGFLAPLLFGRLDQRRR